MKTKFLFSTLVMAAAFSACTQEEIVMNNDAAGNLDEIAGAVLLGNGLSVVSGEVIESRVAIEGNSAYFTEGDKAAVAWAVVGSAADDQSNADITKIGKTLYANHMLVHNGTSFESRGNIYEGWHFAYRPFTYMDKPQQLVIELNGKPLTETDLNIDKYENAPMISNALFLNSDNVVTEEGRVKASMEMSFMVNSLRPTLKISSVFTEHENLQKVKITGITVVAKEHNLFRPEVKVHPKNLEDMNSRGEGDELTSPYIKDTYFGDNSNKAAFVGELESTVSTVIDNAEAYNLGNKNVSTRIFLAPTQDAADVSLEDLSFRIDVAGGHFDVVYTPEQDEEGNDVELTELQSTNNAAIKKLWYWLKGEQEEIYNKNGRDLKKLFANYEDNESNPNCVLEMSLDIDNFEADYLIEDIDDWNGAVIWADALCEEGEVPTFTLKENANVVFTEAIDAPVNGVTVKGNGKIVIAGDMTWNKKVMVPRDEKGLSVEVIEGVKLKVEDAVLAPYRLYNYGIIYADATSTIGAKGYNSLSTNNRIVLEYGAYVYPATNINGDNVIAYEVPAEDYFDKINTLINKGKAGSANVNTLIVGENVTVDCSRTTTTDGSEGSDDRYNPESATQGNSSTVTLDLSSINLEINGGTVESSINPVTVNDIVMNGGEVSNVNVKNKLTLVTGENTVSCETIGSVAVAAGKNTITATSIKGDVVVNGGELTMDGVNVAGDLKNKGTVTIDGEGTTEISNIINDGVLNANTEVVVNTIAVNSGSEANVADGETIWYTIPQIEGGYIQKGTTTGQILFYGTTQFLSDLVNAESGETIALKGNVVISETIQIDKKITIDLNGKEIRLMGATVTSAVFEAGGVNAVLTIEGEGKVHADGAEVGGDGSGVNAVCARDGATIIINGGTFTTNDDKNNLRNDCIYVMTNSSIIINGGTFMYTGKNEDGHKFLLNCKDGNSLITVNGGSFWKHIPALTFTGSDEVKLGNGKKVYDDDNNEASGTATEQWYTVR